MDQMEREFSVELEELGRDPAGAAMDFESRVQWAKERLVEKYQQAVAMVAQRKVWERRDAVNHHLGV
jgi:hypothetical protein